jgi:serine/threonine protein kinase
MRLTGDRVDRYQIESFLGAGGMGEVYVAVDGRLGRRVALKVLAPAGPGASEASAKEAAARMLREARAAAALDHPNAVSVFDVGEVDGAPYIAMELVSGTTLREHVGQREPGWRVRLRWLVDAARALAAAHRRNLIHRDIKPDNVMVRDDGVVKVLDFGIARHPTGPIDPSAPTQSSHLPTLTANGEIIGTPRYMAPEQIKGESFDGRADQFAWGVMAYELLTGRVPWSGGDSALAVTASIIGDTPAPLARALPELPAEVASAIHRALAKTSAERFATMDDLISALHGHADAPDARSPRRPAGAAAHVSASTAPLPLTVVRPRRRWLVPALAASALGAVGATWFATRTPPTSRGEQVRSLPATSSVSSSEPAPVNEPSASTAAATGPGGLLRAKCSAMSPPPSVKPCSDGYVAWCDPGGRRLACCKEGLAATGKDGICSCPPGGADHDADSTCAAPSVSADEENREVQRTVRRQWGDIRRCYDGALERSKTAEGKIAFHFVLTPDGDVFHATINEVSLPDPAAQACALGVVRNLRFPPPSGGAATVLYPVVFAPE